MRIESDNIPSATNQRTSEAEKIRDDLLIQRILSGDESAYNALIQRYLSKVWKLSFSILKNEQEAEDVTQETFLSLWKSLESWDLSGEAKFSTWIYRVTFNKCMDIKRRKKLPIAMSGEELELISETVSAYQTTLHKELSGQLITLLSCLPEIQQTALRLYYFEDLGAAEVGKHMGKSEQSVRSLLKRAKATLRDRIELDPQMYSFVPADFLTHI